MIQIKVTDDDIESTAGDLSAKLEKWNRPLQGLLAVVCLVAVYLIIYPAVGIFFEMKTDWLDSASGLARVYDLSIAPLQWLTEYVGIYERYIDLIFDLYD